MTRRPPGRSAATALPGPPPALPVRPPERPCQIVAASRTVRSFPAARARWIARRHTPQSPTHTPTSLRRRFLCGDRHSSTLSAAAARPRDMAHAPACCPSARGSGDGEMGKSRKVALITGITGQDGSYLAEFLLEKGYEVHGIVRRSSSFNTGRIEHLYKNPQAHTEGNMKLHYGDLTDSTCLVKIINEVKPSEIYNLGAQSHVKGNVIQGNIFPILCIFLDLLSCDLVPQTKSLCRRIDSKDYVFSFGFYVPFHRGANFVTRKISRSVAKIYLGQLECFSLGNLDAKRDWGHAKDYVEAMWLMLQTDEPEDFVIATGEVHSVREFVEKSFSHIGKTIVWEGKNENEVGRCKETGKVHVTVDLKYYRPTEVDFLQGDCTKAKQKLNWKPRVAFDELVREMVDADVELMRNNPNA
ncbi:GDP-mannose 4,6 dehydratase [Erinaceus europaeus]|uniref:GDP-mannose 4,6-dehydratase n=1 Tax=Erinaceus europaeus TaxID=9365 RepID=A0ABM3XD71_ERIEU|nr:GDP-mannose 4,6 dehydratase [Erinaceus europaeus]